jgi:hypothetical protein
LRCHSLIARVNGSSAFTQQTSPPGAGQLRADQPRDKVVGKTAFASSSIAGGRAN